MFTIYADFDYIKKYLQQQNIEMTKKGQLFFANELMRLSNDYVPFDTGALQASAFVGEGGKAIIYNTPYARYLWYGKLMVDPITGKGAFFNSNYGFWSRPLTNKILTERPLVFSGAPRRGKMWVIRAYNDNKSALLNSTLMFMTRGKK